ncbi:MAG: hypothetical protein GX802_00285 [Clostridiales bacterium]|nr:hypothetical protein [Clostridiales bacterium]
MHCPKPHCFSRKSSKNHGYQKNEKTSAGGTDTTLFDLMKHSICELQTRFTRRQNAHIQAILTTNKVFNNGAVSVDGIRISVSFAL